MTVHAFLEEFQDVLQCEASIGADDALADIEEWDSMSMMACMAWFDVKLHISLPYRAFTEVKTVREIIALGQGKIA